MSTVNIINYKDIDINDIEFVNPVKVKGGSYVAVPKYHGEPIYIQTPRLLNTGFNKTEQRCSIELELDNTHIDFYEFITNIDDFNIIEIQKNSVSWFKQDFPLDVVEEFYKTPVKMARNKKPPSLRVKVPLSRGIIDCNIYNLNNKLIDYSQVKDNTKILTVLHFYGLRFLKQQVVCEWVPVQIKVFQKDELNENKHSYIIDDSLLSDNEIEPVHDESNDESNDESMPEKNIIVESNDESMPEKNIIAESNDESMPEKNIIVESNDESMPENNIIVESNDESMPENNIIVESNDESMPENNIIVESNDESMPENNIIVESNDESMPENNIIVESNMNPINIDECNLNSLGLNNLETKNNKLLEEKNKRIIFLEETIKSFYKQIND
jgi:hypothetical protein